MNRHTRQRAVMIGAGLVGAGSLVALVMVLAGGPADGDGGGLGSVGTAPAPVTNGPTATLTSSPTAGPLVVPDIPGWDVLASSDSITAQVALSNQGPVRATVLLDRTNTSARQTVSALVTRPVDEPLAPVASTTRARMLGRPATMVVLEARVAGYTPVRAVVVGQSRLGVVTVQVSGPRGSRSQVTAFATRLAGLVQVRTGEG